MAIITYPLEGITYSASDAETYLCTRTSGVFDIDESFKISIIGGLTVAIAPGQAWVKNADFKGKSICLDARQTLAIERADSSLDRYDRIVLRFDNVNRRSELAIVRGTASATPTVPNITRNSDIYELGLYVVFVPAGMIDVSLNNITDTRWDSDVCGRMSDGTAGYSDLQKQIDKMNHVGTVRLTASGWSNTAPYTQTVAYEHATGDTNEHPFFWIADNATEAQEESFSYIGSMKTNNGSVTFRAVADKPSVNIDVMIKGI